MSRRSASRCTGACAQGRSGTASTAYKRAMRFPAWPGRGSPSTQHLVELGELIASRAAREPARACPSRAPPASPPAVREQHGTPRPVRGSRGAAGARSRSCCRKRPRRPSPPATRSRARRRETPLAHPARERHGGSTACCWACGAARRHERVLDAFVLSFARLRMTVAANRYSCSTASSSSSTSAEREPVHPVAQQAEVGREPFLAASGRRRPAGNSWCRARGPRRRAPCRAARSARRQRCGCRLPSGARADAADGERVVVVASVLGIDREHELLAGRDGLEVRRRREKASASSSTRCGNAAGAGTARRRWRRPIPDGRRLRELPPASRVLRPGPRRCSNPSSGASESFTRSSRPPPIGVRGQQQRPRAKCARPRPADRFGVLKRATSGCASYDGSSGGASFALVSRDLLPASASFQNPFQLLFGGRQPATVCS